MVNLFSREHNKRTRFTRMCIGEAVFVLMDKKEYEKIKISDIVKTAGVSRMTFYHYYETKEDALSDYFHEIVAGYIRGKLVDAKLQYILWDAMNDYMSKRIMPKYKIPEYELYFYGGALLNVFLKWQKDQKKESAEQIADSIIKSMGSPVTSHPTKCEDDGINA